MLNITNQENANQIHSEISPLIHHDGYYQKLGKEQVLARMQRY